ncbi:hypothetical protein [Nocardia alni]|uniref:hypothetical protein n=1 Tax=Nocardia alni TaxID=2815723 RepID=UPI001C22843A|nr:hypothetical protein [Nocardia alni]
MVDASLRPLMYGYLRLDLIEGDVAEWDAKVVEFAEAAGFDLATVFHESDTGSVVPAEFMSMIRELRRSRASAVAIPEGHLRGMATPQICLLDLLHTRALTTVWEMAA